MPKAGTELLRFRESPIMRYPVWTLSVLLAAGAMGSGCHKRQAIAPLPPPSAPSEQQEQPAPEAQAPARRPPSAPKGSAQEKPVPEKPVPEKPVAAPPRAPDASAEPLRLERIVTPEQERRMNAAIDQSLARAEANLRLIANRSLTKEQEGVVSQVRSFIQQAQQARKTDLPAATSLSQRADLLAKDLAGSLH